MTAASRLERVLALALPQRDILEGRVDDALVPSWCERRGWAPFLLSLGDDDVRCAEAHGLAAILAQRAEAPPDLVELSESASQLGERWETRFWWRPSAQGGGASASGGYSSTP